MAAMHQLVFSYEWRRLRAFLELTETQLDEFVHNWQEALDQEAEKIEDEYAKDDFYHFYLDEHHDLLQHKTFLMNSFFAASFTLFEHQLTWLCDHVQRRNESPFSVKDLKYSLMRRAKFYLTKFEITFPSDAPEWSEIGKYQEIRNKIVHEGGYISSEWNHYPFVQQNGLVSDSGGEHRLELTRAFCEKATKDFEQFLAKLSHAIA